MDIQDYWEKVFRKFREKGHDELPFCSVLETRTEAVEGFCRHLPPGGRVLDFGCGTGRNAFAFAERGYAVEVADISREAVTFCLDHAAKVDAPLSAVEIEPDRIRVESHRYDGVLAHAVLDHVTFEMASALAVEFNRVLKPGGMLLVTLDPLGDRQDDDPHETLMDGTVRYTAGPKAGLLYRRYGNREVNDLFSIGWEPLVVLAADPARARDFLYRCDKQRVARPGV